MFRTIGLLFALVPFACQSIALSYAAPASPSSVKTVSEEPSTTKISYEDQEAQIPTFPNPPPLLKQREPVEIPHCERFFIYEGKRLECDSNAAKDAEQLRPYLKDVPAAIKELDTYQENLHQGRLMAYLGTASLLLLIGGAFLSRPFRDPGSGNLKPGGFLVFGGLLLGVNSAIYSITMVPGNDRHLGRAIDFYNAAYPDRPLELQFSTEVNF